MGKIHEDTLRRQTRTNDDHGDTPAGDCAGAHEIHVRDGPVAVGWPKVAHLSEVVRQAERGSPAADDQQIPAVCSGTGTNVYTPSWPLGLRLRSVRDATQT